MGRTCSVNGENRNGYRIYLCEIQKERDHLEDQDMGGWITVKWILDR
jgi:hypothetical protein